MCNVIGSLIFAHQFEYGDPDIIKMIKVLKENMGNKIGLIPEVGGSRAACGETSVLSVFQEEAVDRRFGKETSRTVNHRNRILKLDKHAAMRRQNWTKVRPYRS